VLTYLSYGKKEDHFYVDVSQQHASTIGHGAIMRRYNGNIDVNFSQGLQVDAYNDYGRRRDHDQRRDALEHHVRAGVREAALVLPRQLAGQERVPGCDRGGGPRAPLSLQFEPEPSCPVPNGCAKANVPRSTTTTS